ncbi:MAG TPA: cytochrome C oxidase subunit IV family protein [Bdellovibrionota bacterium]|nr:cytochrome C oxidase subunit IV family protein [Bdellovibrionota bacterium]
MAAKTHSSHLGRYIAVFIALLVLTALTVKVSYYHLAWMGALSLALLIAATKGTLVAAYFMHLVGEHKTIFWVLALTIFLLVFILLVPTLVMWGDYRVH